VNRWPIQTRWPNARAAEFESVSDSLGVARPSLNWMAASNINSDVAIQSNFSGSDSCLTRDQTQFSNPMLDKPIEPGFFDMALERIVQSHVGQTCWIGLSDIALDNCVQCRVGQTHRMGFF
jgi:hypothetical protein